MVFVAFEMLGEQGGIIVGIYPIGGISCCAEVVDDVGYEVAIEIGALLFTRVVDLVVEDGEVEDAFPELFVVAAPSYGNLCAEAADIEEDLVAEDTELTGISGCRTMVGTIGGAIGGRLPAHARTIIIINNGGGVGIVVLHGAYLDKGVVLAWIAFYLECRFVCFHQDFPQRMRGLGSMSCSSRAFFIGL